MIECWHPDPRMRPSFAGLRTSVPIADITVDQNASGYPDLQSKYMTDAAPEVVDSLVCATWCVMMK